MNIKQLVSKKIKIEGVDSNTICDMLSIPPKNDMGDYALPCFSFAKILHCRFRMKVRAYRRLPGMNA